MALPLRRQRELAAKEEARAQHFGLVALDEGLQDADVSALLAGDLYCVICREDVPRESTMSTPRGRTICRSHIGTPAGDRELLGRF